MEVSNPNPISEPQETASWHHVYRAHHLHARRKKTHPQKLKRLGIFEIAKDRAILDVCCGAGEMLEILVQAGFQNLTGVDLNADPNMTGKSWRFVPGTATQLPIASESMDAIYCAHALHHLGSQAAIETFIAEAWRCLKPGGKLGIIDHYDSLQLRIVFGLFQSRIGSWLPATRDFHEQLLEEKSYLYVYLDSWKNLEKVLNTTSFKNYKIEKDPFFFYWTGYKQ